MMVATQFNVPIGFGVFERISKSEPARNFVSFMPYGVAYKTFQFKSFQANPSLPEDLLLKSMDGIVRLLNFAAIIGIEIVTALYKWWQNIRLKTTHRRSSIIASLIASVIDQPISSELQNSTIYGSSWLALV